MKFISNYKCVGNKVFLSTGHILIEAEGEIEMCLSIDDYIILLLDWKHAQNGANVYGYNWSDPLWIIPEQLGVYKKSCFTSIYIDENFYLYAYEKSGVEYKLNYKTGEVISSALVK
jgi:hypothetical protein